VRHNGSASEPGPTTFTVTADGKTSEQKVNREDIDDSCQDMDSFANTKVNIIVSKLSQSG
jgi:hypothetical protein